MREEKLKIRLDGAYDQITFVYAVTHNNQKFWTGTWDSCAVYVYRVLLKRLAVNGSVYKEIDTSDRSNRTKATCGNRYDANGKLQHTGSLRKRPAAEPEPIREVRVLTTTNVSEGVHVQQPESTEFLQQPPRVCEPDGERAPVHLPMG